MSPKTIERCSHVRAEAKRKAVRVFDVAGCEGPCKSIVPAGVAETQVSCLVPSLGCWRSLACNCELAFELTHKQRDILWLTCLRNIATVLVRTWIVKAAVSKFLEIRPEDTPGCF
jgi:hypothetical protein